MARAPRWLVALVAANVLFLAVSLAAALEWSKPPWPDVTWEEPPPLPPALVVPAEENGAEVVRRAVVGLPDLGKEGTPLASDTSWDHGVPPEAEAVLADFAPSLDQLREARGMPISWAGRPPYPAMGAARLLALSARAALARGNADEAAARLRDGVDLGARMMWEPRADLTQSSVGRSMVTTVLRPLWEHPGAPGEMSTETLEAWQADLEALAEGRRPVEEAQVAEAEAVMRPDPALRFLVPGAEGRKLLRGLLLSRVEPLRRRDFASLRRLAVDLEARSDGRDGHSFLLGFVMRRSETAAWMQTSLLTLEPARWAPWRLSAEFQVDALRTLVAAELSGRGAAGARLPRPQDPFAPGRLLRYGEGRVWSVGPDGVDDGGRSRLTLDHLEWRSRGDLVLP